MSVFENELEQLERITGIHIGECSNEEMYVLSIATKKVTRRTTWHKPEPFRLGMWEWAYEWAYLYCLAIGTFRQLGWLN